MRYFKCLVHTYAKARLNGTYPETHIMADGRTVGEWAFDYPSEWSESLCDLNDITNEQAFINQCAIKAMPPLLHASIFTKNEDIAMQAFDLSEAMNEERKKRIKKSSS